MFTKVLRSFGMRGRVLTLDAPISGDVIPLSEVNDQTFATGLLGQGVAIQPTGTRVIAPHSRYAPQKNILKDNADSY